MALGKAFVFPTKKVLGCKEGMKKGIWGMMASSAIGKVEYGGL